MLPPADPSCTDQVTVWSARPGTEARICMRVPGAITYWAGFTTTGGGRITVTVVLTPIEPATLCTATEYVPASAGATYLPFWSIVPPSVDQITLLSERPVTVTVNCSCSPVMSVGASGEIPIPAGQGVLTMATAVADFDE